jgi:hypothetical protein
MVSLLGPRCLSDRVHSPKRTLEQHGAQQIVQIVNDLTVTVIV